MKLEINYRKKNGKIPKTQKVNNILLIKQWKNEETKEEVRNYLVNLKWKPNSSKSLGCNESISKTDIYSSTGLPQETRKISNKKHKPHPKGIRKRITIQNQQKERKKIRGDINKNTYTRYSNTQ